MPFREWQSERASPDAHPAGRRNYLFLCFGERGPGGPRSQWWTAQGFVSAHTVPKS
jgi:hypothetical protein